ncbi:MAG: GtrA family protein [Bacteroidetes bacterium]|nr:GtrA family protein [Bacteroidota bacterium]
MGTRRELFRFAFAGGTAVGVDLLTYYLLSAWWGPSYTNEAKGISFVIGSVVAYFINKLWTFDKQGYSGGEVLRFAIVYGISFLLNVLLNHLSLTYLSAEFPYWSAEVHKLLAFLIATGASSTSNFVGMKYWVFRQAA